MRIAIGGRFCSERIVANDERNSFRIKGDGAQLAGAIAWQQADCFFNLPAIYGFWARMLDAGRGELSCFPD